MTAGMSVPVPDLDLGDRRVVSSFPDYASAQKAVDTLSDRGFDVSRVSIVGSDLRMVENVLGRMTTARAALAGAVSGLWFGLLLGLIFGIATPYFLIPLVWGLVLGAVFGAIFGALGHAAYRGTRDFSSARTIVAQRYDVMVDANSVAEAHRTLTGQQW